MSVYIKINERSNKAKSLMRYIKSIADEEDFIEIIDEAVSPTMRKAYNLETQKTLKSKSSIKIDNVDDFFDSI